MFAPDSVNLPNFDLIHCALLAAPIKCKHRHSLEILEAAKEKTWVEDTQPTLLGLLNSCQKVKKRNRLVPFRVPARIAEVLRLPILLGISKMRISTCAQLAIGT